MRQQTAFGVPEDVIRFDGVTKAYQAGAPPALADVSLSVAAGEVAAVMGPSGSGKSTLLNLVAGLDRPTSGTVTVAGRRIDTLGEGALARFRARHVGIIFQFFNLLDDLTVADNVLLPAQLAGASRRRARARAAELLERMGIERHRNDYPARLHGGVQPGQAGAAVPGGARHRGRRRAAAGCLGRPRPPSRRPARRVTPAAMLTLTSEPRPAGGEGPVQPVKDGLHGPFVRADPARGGAVAWTP